MLKKLSVRETGDFEERTARLDECGVHCARSCKTDPEPFDWLEAHFVIWFPI